jgi:uncharacterized protein related to proFAR isomerase
MEEDAPESDAQESDFLVIPAISIRKRRVVVVNNGRYEPLTDVDDKELSLYDFVAMFLDQYSTILVLDIDGIERRKPQLTQIQTVTQLKNVWWDPGVRSLEDMMDTFTAGANRVVVGTKSIWNIEELRSCQEFSSDFVLGLDWSDGILSRDANISQADPIDFLRDMHDEGVRRILFSQLGRVRSGSRIDTGFVKEMRDVSRRLYLGGSGFSLDTVRDVERANMGIRGIVVGVMDIIRDSLVEDQPEYDEGSVVHGEY